MTSGRDGTCPQCSVEGLHLGRGERRVGEPYQSSGGAAGASEVRVREVGAMSGLKQGSIGVSPFANVAGSFVPDTGILWDPPLPLAVPIDGEAIAEHLCVPRVLPTTYQTLFLLISEDEIKRFVRNGPQPAPEESGLMYFVPEPAKTPSANSDLEPETRSDAIRRPINERERLAGLIAKLEFQYARGKRRRCADGTYVVDTWTHKLLLLVFVIPSDAGKRRKWARDLVGLLSSTDEHGNPYLSDFLEGNSLDKEPSANNLVAFGHGPGVENPSAPIDDVPWLGLSRYFLSGGPNVPADVRHSNMVAWACCGASTRATKDFAWHSAGRSTENARVTAGETDFTGKIQGYGAFDTFVRQMLTKGVAQAAEIYNSMTAGIGLKPDTFSERGLEEHKALKHDRIVPPTGGR